MADSVQIPQYISPATILNEGYSAGYNMREGERKKKLQNLTSEFLTSAGTLPTQFIREAASKGIGMEGLEAYFQNLKSNASTAADVARSSTELEALGRNPDAGREWKDNPYNTTTITSTQDPYSSKTSPSGVMLSPVTPNAPTTAPSTVSGGSTIPVTEQLEQMIKPKAPEVDDQGTVMNLGQGTITGRAPNQDTFTLPPDNEPGYTYDIKGPKEYSAVEEMLRRTGTNPLAINTGITSATSGPEFNYDALSSSSAGVQLKAGIDNALRKLGQEPGQGSVDKLLSYAGSTVPAPRIHYKDGKLDMDATIADRNEYPSKVAKAKQDMIEKLVSGNTTAIGEVLSQAGNVRAEEQQKYDLAGQKGASFVRPVSKDEAARVRVLNETIDDVIGAKRIGGFEGDYQAAVAKAKADGSVNKDAIVANLIAMGTVPSNRSVFLKSVMDANGNIPGDIWNQVKAAAGEVFVADNAKRESWYNGTIDNMNQSIARNGGLTREVPKEKVGDVLKGNPAELKAKLEQEKKRRPVTHKNGDTWSDATYNYRMINGQIQRKRK